MPDEKVICAGVIERIGLEGSKLSYKANGKFIEKVTDIDTHQEGLKRLVSLLIDTEVGVITSTDEIKAVGHRIVHGGNSLRETIEITNEVKRKIKDLFPLAPLHNPANLNLIDFYICVFVGIYSLVKYLS